jgi:uncharacterized protein YlxW (UPF0749 family)
VSLDTLISSVPAGAEGDSESHAWLQLLLRAAMEQVMAAEGSAIQKANSLARLAGLYLKTCQLTELKQAQKQLAARVADLEEALASLQAAPDERDSVGERNEKSSAGRGRSEQPVTGSAVSERSYSLTELAFTAPPAGSDSASRGAHQHARAPGHQRRR